MPQKKPGYIRTGMLFRTERIAIQDVPDHPNVMALRFDCDDGIVQFALVPSVARQLARDLSAMADMIEAHHKKTQN